MNRFRRLARRFIAICYISFIGIQAAHGLDASNVLVIYNNDSPEGVEIAEYYAQARPGVRLLGLDGVSTQEQVCQDHYLDVIRPQVLAGLDDSIDVIVTTKGLPLRISNTAPNPGTYPGWRGKPFGVPILEDWWESYSSLESELTRIDTIDSSAMMGDQASFMSPPSFPYATAHHAANTYYNADYKADQPFDRNNPDYEGIRLTSRLDAFSVDDVKGIIDRAQYPIILPSQQFIIVDDDPDAPAASVDRMPYLAFNVLEPHEQTLVFDWSVANINDAPMPVIGYVSHGSHAAGSEYTEDLEFDVAEGAVFHTWESFNAYSFQEDNNLHGQGLIAEWIEMGATAALGHVQEPGASAATVANEDILWDMLLKGYTFAEAAWAATPQLSFVNTVVGDPLMVLSEWTPGDATLDGQVSIDDLSVVLSAWNQNVTGGVIEGDLTGDGFVGIKDLSLVLSSWNGDSSQTSPVVVPEPATAIMSAFGGCLILSRMCFRRQGSSKST